MPTTSVRHKTNTLLDLCRHGIRSENDQVTTAAQELSSYVVAVDRYMDFEVDIPEILLPNVATLVDYTTHKDQYPKDMELDQPE